MMKAGIKKRPMAAAAQRKNRVHIQREVRRFDSGRSAGLWSCDAGGNDALIVDDGTARTILIRGWYEKRHEREIVQKNESPDPGVQDRGRGWAEFPTLTAA